MEFLHRPDKPSFFAQVSDCGFLRKVFWELTGDVFQKKWHAGQAKTESKRTKVLILYVLLRLWVNFKGRKYMRKDPPVGKPGHAGEKLSSVF